MCGICTYTFLHALCSTHLVYVISGRLDLFPNMWPSSWMGTAASLGRKTWNVWKGTCRASTSWQRWDCFASFSSEMDLLAMKMFLFLFIIQYMSCFFRSRHYVGVNIWTSRRLQSMPLALRTLSAQKKRWMDWWNWPDRSLSNCWRSGKYQLTFLIIWWIVKMCASVLKESSYMQTF